MERGILFWLTEKAVKLWMFWDWKRDFILFSVILAYIYFGGIAFRHIENISKDDKLAHEQISDVNSVYAKYSQLFSQISVVSAFDLGKFYKEIEVAKDKEEESRHLSYSDSVYYCITLISTVGYGDVVPRSDAGKLFTIIYGLAGMALMGLLVADGVLLFRKIYYTLYANIVNLPHKVSFQLHEEASDHSDPKGEKQAASYQQQDSPNQPKFSERDHLKGGDEMNKHEPNNENSSQKKEDSDGSGGDISRSITLAVIAFCALYFFIIFLPGFVLQRHVDWDLLSIHYFLFVSFTTTGFGDFSLRESDSSDFLQLGFFIYLLIGLCALGGLLSTIQAVFPQTEKKVESQFHRFNSHH